MAMFYSVIGMLQCLLVLVLIGTGPTLLCFPHCNNLSFLFAVTPVIGLVMTTLIGTSLVAFDLPITVWAMWWLVIATIFSSSVILAKLAKKNYYFVRLDASFWVLCLGFIIVISLLSLPFILGDLSYSILRGNGTDEFNYLTLADALLHKPYSWFFRVAEQTLISQNPVYFLAKQLLSDRWSVAMLLGFFSYLIKVPIYTFIYLFMVLLFALNYSLVFLFSLRLQLNSYLAVLLAISICVGFWPQFIIDIQALSCISSFPIIFLLLVFLDKAMSEEFHFYKNECVYFAIIFIALLFLYVEISIVILLGFIFFLGINLLVKRKILPKLIYYFSVLIFFSLISFFLSPHLKNFFFSQIHSAVNAKNTWDKAYFIWLFSKHALLGFWGMSPLLNSSIIVKEVINLMLYGLAFSLSIGLLTGLLTIFILKEKLVATQTLCIAMLFSGLLIFSYLFLKDQRWAAGKLVSYIYPFAILTSVSTLSHFNTQMAGYFKKIIIKIMQKAIYFYLGLQIFIGLYHVEKSYLKQEYPNYLAFHSEYRQHDWNFTHFQTKIRENCKFLALDIKNAWLAEYLSFVFSWNAPLLSLRGAIDHDGTYFKHPILLLQYPDCILVDNYSKFFNGKSYLTKNSEVWLIKIAPDDFLKTLKKYRQQYNIYNFSA
jgi:hypothetical protein